MRLIIVRHGETIENIDRIIQGHLPGKLSEKGKEQVKKLAERLTGEKISYIYFSDLARAADTASEIIKLHPGVPAGELKMIRERYLGELQGKKMSELRDQVKTDKFEGLLTKFGESIDDLSLRAANVIQILLLAHPDDNVLLVTHGGIGKAIISSLEGMGVEGYKTLPALSNTSITEYDIDEENNAMQRSFNNIDHLL